MPSLSRHLSHLARLSRHLSYLARLSRHLSHLANSLSRHLSSHLSHLASHLSRHISSLSHLARHLASRLSRHLSSHLSQHICSLSHSRYVTYTARHITLTILIFSGSLIGSCTSHLRTSHLCHLLHVRLGWLHSWGEGSSRPGIVVSIPLGGEAKLLAQGRARHRVGEAVELTEVLV